MFLQRVRLFRRAKDLELIAGVCLACSKVLGVYEKNRESGLTMLNDMSGHAGMKDYIDNEYKVISM